MQMILSKLTFNYRGLEYLVEAVDGVVNDLIAIRRWCDQNNIICKEHADDYIWFFKNKNDAILFVLTWSGDDKD